MLVFQALLCGGEPVHPGPYLGAALQETLQVRIKLLQDIPPQHSLIVGYRQSFVHVDYRLKKICTGSPEYFIAGEVHRQSLLRGYLNYSLPVIYRITLIANSAAVILERRNLGLMAAEDIEPC